MKIISANSFKDIWELYSKEKIAEKWNKNYSGKEWTDAIIGSASSKTNEGSLFGDFVKEKNPKISYGTEHGKIDLCFFSNQNFQNIKYTDNTDVPLQEYSLEYYVLIENELVTDNAWEEMIKLTYYRSRLKVLITYLYNQNKYKEELDVLKHNFSTILQQTNENAISKENPDTEYLLIVANSDRKEILPGWNYIVYDIFGRIKFESKNLLES